MVEGSQKRGIIREAIARRREAHLPSYLLDANATVQQKAVRRAFGDARFGHGRVLRAMADSLKVKSNDYSGDTQVSATYRGTEYQVHVLGHAPDPRSPLAYPFFADYWFTPTQRRDHGEARWRYLRGESTVKAFQRLDDFASDQLKEAGYKRRERVVIEALSYLAAAGAETYVKGLAKKTGI